VADFLSRPAKKQVETMESETESDFFSDIPDNRYEIKQFNAINTNQVDVRKISILADEPNELIVEPVKNFNM
jgi:hypothetical protein